MRERVVPLGLLPREARIAAETLKGLEVIARLHLDVGEGTRRCTTIPRAAELDAPGNANRSASSCRPFLERKPTIRSHGRASTSWYDLIEQPPSKSVLEGDGTGDDPDQTPNEEVCGQEGR